MRLLSKRGRTIHEISANISLRFCGAENAAMGQEQMCYSDCWISLTERNKSGASEYDDFG